MFSLLIQSWNKILFIIDNNTQNNGIYSTTFSVSSPVVNTWAGFYSQVYDKSDTGNVVTSYINFYPGIYSQIYYLKKLFEIIELYINYFKFQIKVCSLYYVPSCPNIGYTGMPVTFPTQLYTTYPNITNVIVDYYQDMTSYIFFGGNYIDWYIF